jgi:PHD/YefM family antitoxin component YafN of YafNO toxin-antitoxin module
MLFYADEHLRFDAAQTIVAARGHSLVRVLVTEKDPMILAAAERDAAVILTADKWFHTQLRRTGHIRSIYRRAGVIRVLGEWPAAAILLREWLPLIEVAYDLMQQKPDKRLVVEMRSSTILIDA